MNAKRKRSSLRAGTKGGFTLIELLVVIAIIAILASLLLPVLSRSRLKALGVVCLNNLKQDTLAWYTYAEDNNDVLVPNNPATFGGPDGKPFATWAWGNMRYGSPDGTNADYVVGRREGSLGPYVKTYQVFKCPADKSLTTLSDGNRYPRVRSYSMNEAMGSELLSELSPGTVTFLKRADIMNGPRRELCVFMDLHEDYIDYGGYWLDWDYNREAFVNLPASRHGGSGVLSYTDGHAELHRWKDPRTFQPVKGVQARALDCFGSPDWSCVFVRTTKSAPGSGHDW